jgi:hypothetical protein
VARIDWKRGRWGAEIETQQIADALHGYQPAFGDQVSYFRFDLSHSVKHNVYDEATSTGRAFKGPVEVPVLHVIHEFGGDTLNEAGFYTNDELQVTCGFRQLGRTGLTHADLRNGRYLRDRIAYDDKLYRILEMDIRGQLVRSDIVVGIRGVQLKSDEIVDDGMFRQYMSDPNRLGASGT